MKPGERVAKLRKLRGLSQTELGRMVGLSQSSLSHLESGGRKLIIEEADRLARALQCDVGDLVRQADSITITFHRAPAAPDPTPGPGAVPQVGHKAGEEEA